MPRCVFSDWRRQFYYVEFSSPMREDKGDTWSNLKNDHLLTRQKGCLHFHDSFLESPKTRTHSILSAFLPQTSRRILTLSDVLLFWIISILLSYNLYLCVHDIVYEILCVLGAVLSGQPMKNNMPWYVCAFQETLHMSGHSNSDDQYFNSLVLSICICRYLW